MSCVRALVLWCALVVCSAHLEKPYYDLNHAEQLFTQFMHTYHKQYDTEHEKQYRFEVFKQNLDEINKLNQGDGAVFGITKFSDMTPTEFKESILCLRGSMEDAQCSSLPAVKDTAPNSFDWRTKNVVTPTKDQQKCGSCWAFSAIGNVEGQYAIKHSKLVAFSEQQLVDCDKKDSGCDGGWMAQAFRYLIGAGGSVSEADYPYKAKSGTCAFDKKKVVAKLTDCHSYQVNEDEMMSTLHAVGPLSIAIDASGLQNYHNTIMKAQDCPAGELNHGVLLIGYGTENGTPYWLIKNSWGASWGEKGYCRIERGVNACNITAAQPVTSVVA